MISTYALRETLILILFGIILVPIAAKRAQDARGYWQTFQQLDPFTNNKDLVVATSTTPSPTFTSLVVAAPPPPPIVHCVVQHNETYFPEIASASSSHASSAPRTLSGTTILFGNGGAAEMTTEDSVAVMATAAPRIPTPTHASLRAEADDVQRMELPQTGAVTIKTTPTQAMTAAQVSDASSKGRWTLIWMASAIATVAGLMSLC